jgi:hypothetical protein
MLLRANKFRKDKESDCRRNELGSRIFMGRVFGDYAECLHFYPSFSYGRIIAGESQGVVRAPWQTHLPAVRAVWDFRTGVVERAKTALLGSEAQIVPLFQGKQRGCAQNWRKIGMANKKIKFPLWLMPDTKATVECLYRQDGCNSQSEFIEKAIQFYCGYLQSEYAGDFLPKILGETLEAILSMFGDHIGKLLLKQAVEQNVCNHILASDTDIDAQTYQQMRGKSYQEVLRTNGQISFPEVLRQQSRL